MVLQRERDISHFFIPHSQTASTIPQKRKSDQGAADQDSNVAARVATKTPAKSVKFKDVTPRSARTPLGLSPANSLPIRSPKKAWSPSPNKGRQTRLFQEMRKSPSNETKPDSSYNVSDTLERSQKVIEHGKVIAILDSDDDTDSLQSLDDILGRKKDANPILESSSPEDTEAERVRTLSMFTFGRSVPIVGKDKLRALYAKERATKFDLRTVLDDHFEDEEMQQSISRMRAGFDGNNDLNEDDHLDKEFLASVVKVTDDDGDNVERLLNAVDRTEALSTDRTFRFFNKGADIKDEPLRRPEFPEPAIPYRMWPSADLKAQDRAFLSGYMSELAASDDLSDAALSWVFHQVVREPRMELQQAYVGCLKAGSKSWTRLNLTATEVQLLFQTLGADAGCLRDASSIEPRYHPIPERPKRDYSHLLSALQMFQALCYDMDFPALSKLTSIVLRLTLDGSVMTSNQVCFAVERLIETLLGFADQDAQTHIYNRMLSDVTGHLHDPGLQIQLLRHILPSSPAAIDLRKTLAGVFILGPSIVDPQKKRSKATLDDFTSHVSNSPSFSLTQHANSPAVNYSTMTALTQILNVAVSSGNPASHDLVPSLSSSQPSARKQTAEEVRFNGSVDALADTLHDLFVSIKDTGASHMRRTEAKDALQALYFRLLFSVRTTVRKKRHVFDANGASKTGKNGTKGRWVSGEEWREQERGGEFMKKFLVKKEEF